MATTAYYGNSWLGMFVKTNDTLTLVPKDTLPKFVELAGETLQTRVLPVSIGYSNLLGLYCAMNRNGMVLPNVTTEEEMTELKQTGLNLYRSPERFNAHGNNILVNDKAGLVNQRIELPERKRMQDALDVELLPAQLAGYTTVGSTCLVNNKGWLAHFSTLPQEERMLEEVFGTKGGKGSLNMGAGFVGLAAVANNRGYLAGEASSAFECGRVEEAMGFL